MGYKQFRGASETANAAACANLLFSPTTKLSNVYFGLRFDLLYDIPDEFIIDWLFGCCSDDGIVSWSSSEITWI